MKVSAFSKSNADRDGGRSRNRSNFGNGWVGSHGRPAIYDSIAVANGNGVNHLTQFAVEIIAEMFEQLPMDGLSHPIAIAHMQGLKAGKSAGTTPLDCPWPTESYGACLAWFSGYSIGNLASYNGHRSDDTKDLDKNQISDEPANTTPI